MVILGVDPGLATLGYGIIDTSGPQTRVVAKGVHTTPASDVLPDRLVSIHKALTALVKKYRVGEFAVEELFFSKNARNAFAVGQARGAILLTAGQCGLPVYEYTPQAVKESVTGFGAAEKPQIQEMVRRLLGLAEKPTPDDCADALAVALCHAQSRGLRRRLESSGLAAPGTGRRANDSPTARRLKAAILKASA